MNTAASTLEQVLLEHALSQTLTRYATACDTRNWDLLQQVFTPDCTTIYGGSYTCEGVARVRHMISTHLDGCGPTQHLLGNLEVDASNLVHPRSKIQVRAVHQGLGERAHLRYDAIGFYEDEWLQLPQGWRIQKRSMTMLLEIGDRSVLQPAPKP
ncbi:MAG: nuclear transport factor 2 family protein [Comamonas sp.]